MDVIPSTVPSPTGSGPPDPASRVANVSLSPIIGRDEEIRQIIELIDQDDVRVVSLLGPGGVGKTRLALEVTGLIGANFAHGARIVPLDAVRDPALVPTAVARSLGLQETVARPATHLLPAYLRERHILLVLDNMEQVIDAAHPWLAGLLRQAPRLKVLVTSRIPLSIDGERQFSVTPLETGTEPGQNPAVMLFSQRARAVRQDFILDAGNLGTVAEICRSLDGLPLAIELAAARIKVLSPEALLARLTDRLTLLTGGHRDAPQRLRSMRDAIGWSYMLLSQEEQALFRRLSVFLGGFSLEAAEFVAAWPEPTGSQPSGIGLLQSLVDQSLVRAVTTAPEPRFWMLETIREFGVERISLERDDQPWAAHADYMRDLALRSERELVGRGQAHWLEVLEADYPNLRAAISWLEQHARLGDAIEIITQVCTFVSMSGHVVEVLGWLETWFAELSPHTSARQKAHLLSTTGGLLRSRGDFAGAARLLKEAVDIYVDVGDSYHAAGSASALGVALALDDQRAEAIAVAQDAIDLAQDAGHHRARSVSLWLLAQDEWLQGTEDRALAYANQALAIAQRHGDTWMMARSRLVPILDALNKGRLDEAEAIVRQSMRLLEDVHSYDAMVRNTAFLGAIARARGDAKEAEHHFATSRRIAEETGQWWQQCLIANHAAILAAERHDGTHARELLTVALESFETHHRLDHLTDTLATCAIVAHVSGDAVDAVRFMAASETRNRQVTSIRKEPLDVELHPYRAHIVSALDVARYRREYALGASWSIDDAIAAGLAYTPSSRQREAVHRSPPGGLSQRELDVLAHMAKGMSNRQIADTLFVSHRTVTTHVTHIMTKLDVASRTAAVAWAIRNGIA